MRCFYVSNANVPSVRRTSLHCAAHFAGVSLPHDFLADRTPEGWQDQGLNQVETPTRSGIWLLKVLTYFNVSQMEEKTLETEQAARIYLACRSSAVSNFQAWYCLNAADLSVKSLCTRMVLFWSFHLPCTLRRGSGRGRRHCPQPTMPPQPKQWPWHCYVTLHLSHPNNVKNVKFVIAMTFGQLHIRTLWREKFPCSNVRKGCWCSNFLQKNISSPNLSKKVLRHVVVWTHASLHLNLVL